MKLYPMIDCIRRAEPFMDKGATVYQQFLCASCGAKQTMDEANKFFAAGICERCGHQTNILAAGCNYALYSQIGGILIEEHFVEVDPADPAL